MSKMNSEKTIRCDRCNLSRNVKQTTKGLARVPMGWKRIGAEVLCRSCMTSAYMLRAITVPIAYPVGREKKELWEACGECWRMSTELANWAVTELAKADIVRSGTDEKLGAFPGVYLYPGARQRCPVMNPQSVTALLRAVEQRYRKRRHEVIWQSSASLPRYKYPAPYPVHNQGWKLRRVEKGYYEIDTRIKGELWILRLAGGSGYWRQQLQMDSIVTGKAIQGELAFLRRKVSERKFQIVAKMVAWLPKHESASRPRHGELKLFTRGDRFWEAVFPGQNDPWQINADHVRTWIAGHKQRLERIANDKRVMTRKWRLAELERRAAKQHSRLQSFMQMSAAAVAKMAVRSGVAAVIYDDSARDYMSNGFPWSQLREILRNRLDEEGIGLTLASGKVESENPDPLEEGEDQ